jgi:hypothetical protein
MSIEIVGREPSFPVLDALENHPINVDFSDP